MAFNRHALNSTNIHVLSHIQHIPLIGPNDGRQVVRTTLKSSVGPFAIFHSYTIRGFNPSDCSSVCPLSFLSAYKPIMISRRQTNSTVILRVFPFDVVCRVTRLSFQLLSNSLLSLSSASTTVVHPSSAPQDIRCNPEY
jgi:hypothetical protein